MSLTAGCPATNAGYVGVGIGYSEAAGINAAWFGDAEKCGEHGHTMFPWPNHGEVCGPGGAPMGPTRGSGGAMAVSQ